MNGNLWIFLGILDICRFLLPVGDTSQVWKGSLFCVTNTTDQMEISIVIIIITIGTLHALSPCLWPIHGWPRLSALLRVWSQSLSAYWRHRHHRHHHRFHSSDHLVKKWYFDFFLFLCCIALYMGLLGNLKCAQVKSNVVRFSDSLALGRPSGLGNLTIVRCRVFVFV